MSTTISPLKIIPEKNQEIKTQEKMETYIPTASLKTEIKSENELNEKKKAKKYQNEKVKKRQISKFKSLKQYKTENDMITIEVSNSDNNGIDEIAHGSKENGKGEEINGFVLSEECNYEPIII